jgi:hypothetical protein
LIAGQNQTDSYDNIYWTSTDGQTWSTASGTGFTGGGGGGRSFLSAVVFDAGSGEKVWAIGGINGATYYNEVYVFEVMSNQETAAAFATGRKGHTSVALNGKMWVIGGYNNGTFYNTVYYSSNGTTWTDAAATNHFTPRDGHTSVAFGGKLWVIGGYEFVTTSKMVNDVWSSSDGVTWTNVSAHNASATDKFSPRYQHKSVVFQDKIWVIGGMDSTNRYNDVWCSKDGIAWTQVTDNGEFEKRGMHAVSVLNNKIYLIGGIGTSSNRYLDVWVSNQ